MDGPPPFDNLLAYGFVFTMATAMALPLLQSVLREWRQRARASDLRALASAVLLLVFVYEGGSLDKRQGSLPPSEDPRQESVAESPAGNGNLETENAGSVQTRSGETLPTWYLALCYPTTDTDGDGIPDRWERFTRTDRLVVDSAADPDHDGVDNAEEFWHECDPHLRDTDGDGLTDREEIDGAALGMVGFDPLSRCDYPEDTSDAEAWGTGWHPVRFVGVNDDGFPLNVGYPDEAEDNVDVLLTVDSSRYVELTWEDEFGEKGLLLPPCTNLVLRLRVPAAESSSVSLAPATNALGLWKAALRAEWDARRGLDIERNRVRPASGWIVDVDGVPSVFAGVLPGTFAATNEPMRSSGPHRQASNQNAPPLSLSMHARRAFGIEMSATCRIHGPNPTFQGAFTNAVSPFLWTVNGQDYTTPDPMLTVPLTADEYHVGCFDSGGYSLLPLGTNAVFHAGSCQGGPVTNIVGASWTSTHNPTNAIDHLPGVEEIVECYGPLCPVFTNTVVHAGWTHDEMILWLRNLVRKLTGKPEDDDTDHCINVTWYVDGTINLWEYLDPICLPYTNALSIRVWENGVVSGLPLHLFHMGSKPSEMLPNVKNIVLCDTEGVKIYDRFWLVISSPKDATSFTDWYDTFSTNLAWTATLPLPPIQLTMTTNSSGRIMASTPSPYMPQWSSPKVFGNADFMHHIAKYELRTEIASQYGNQATYNESGFIITNSISAGTSDFFGPYNAWGYATRATSHKEMDVFPFLQALQLDGNPGLPSPFKEVPRQISHPCLRMGNHLTEYLFCRPCIY